MMVEDGKSEAKPVKRTTTKRMRLKRDAFFKKEEPEKPKEKVEVVVDNAVKDEVEEGELGTLKSPKKEVENGEVIPEKSSVKREIEKGEIVGDKWRKEEMEKSVFFNEKWRERSEFSLRGRGRGRGRGRSDAVVKREMVFEEKWRGAKGEDEKGEFIPERWHKGSYYNHEYNNQAKSQGREFLSNNRLKRQGGDLESSDRKLYDDYGDFVSLKSRRLSGEGFRSEHYSRQFAEKVFRNSNSGRGGQSSQKLSTRQHYDSSSSRGGYEKFRRSPSYSERSPIRERGRYNDLRELTPVRQERSPPGYRGNRHDTRASPSYSERSPPNGCGMIYDRRDRSISYVEWSPHDKGRDRVHDHKERSPSYLEHSPHDKGRDRVYDRKERSPSYFERSPQDKCRDRVYDHKDRSPSYFERSPQDKGRDRVFDRKDRSPSYFEQSPLDKGRDRVFDRKDRSPSYFEQSPRDKNRDRAFDRKERSPSYLEPSPYERTKFKNRRQTSKKSDISEAKQNDRAAQEVMNHKVSIGSIIDSQNEKSLQNETVVKCISLNVNTAAHDFQCPIVNGSDEPHLANGVMEELPSMEEDMDICDTPPHVPSVTSSNPGKWYYIDHYGEERGPSRLGDLKVLVEQGVMMSDHLIKRSDSDRWVTVENAASPMVPANFTTVFSDTAVQPVNPLVAPGNLLVEAEQGDDQVCIKGSDDLGKVVSGSDLQLVMKNFCIDERVGSLLDGFTVVPGKELDILGEVLQMTFDESEWDKFSSMQGVISSRPYSKEHSELTLEEDVQGDPESAENGSAESMSTASFDKERGYFLSEFDGWFSGWWTCKGGDWQRNEEVTQDKLFRKINVLNDGYPLCQMTKSGYEDPRWQRKDDLYYPCQSRKLDLPPWAICCPDERNDNSAVNKACQTKSLVRGVKGTMMPVIRINGCVFNDHGSIVSDSRSKPRGKDKYSSRGTKHYSSSSDVKSRSVEDTPHSKIIKEQDTVINKPHDRVCTVDDLLLHLGDWYYLDGAGHECGPFSCSALQKLVEEGCLKIYSSIIRKVDNVWAPVISVIKAFEDSVKCVKDNSNLVGESLEAPAVVYDGSSSTSSSFHNLHPQFIGYTLGKLHEFVMRSYKSREFAAAINDVLDPWINCRQPKKEMEKHLYNKLLSKGLLGKSVTEYDYSIFHEDDVHVRKRCRTLIGGIEEGYGFREVIPTLCYDDLSFEDLCGDVAFSKGDEHSETPAPSWGLLDGHILSRIFHFLRADIKSLVFVASTCKHWRAAVGFYKKVSIRVDLSTVGVNCSDSAVGSIMNGYSKQSIKALVLDGCTNISSALLEEILQSFSCISSVGIRGCSQFEELMIKFPHVTWVKEQRTTEESYLRTRSLKQISEQASSVMKSSHGSCVDESSGLKDYFDMVEKRGASNQTFRQITYKRTKLGDTRKSALVLAREARMRHWAIKKAGCGYRKMEEFLVLSLKDILKENTSDYFVRKVAEIENRVKSGYYARHGMSAAKQDVMKMCRDAIKKKDRGDGGDMEHVLALFIKLGTCLDKNFKTAIDIYGVVNKSKDGTGRSSGNKKHTKRKILSRGNSALSHNGSFDHVECLSERESGNRFSRTNKKMESDSESSDDFELSSDEFGSDSESVSDTASDSDVRLESNTLESKEGYYTENDSFDFIPDDREWGARMTKASHVPPVTRKYEVIDEYVIVADEVEVRRKMQVSLPDNYEDKVRAQKNGSEVDMEIPEVKEYKPRKQLGEEVIEQEVYGIDPYTYNLLLDSMAKDVDWSLVEKHKFIEDVVLRVLNKQVRHYTGSESTPMKYELKLVIEEILKTAIIEHNTRTVKLCEVLLQAIDSRSDSYVSYRKGLGVVCDKEGGFAEDDFIVEFLGEVYPAWKWFEKQDGIRSLQKNSKDVTEFYNIYLERPKGDADGYDLIVVDAMHKANYASRICHSCRPNCEAKVTAVGGQYQIGIYSVRPIAFGEEITFDYNSVTESKQEYEAAVCLCGSQVCRGSYLNLTGEGAYDKVLKEWHGLLDKHRLLLEACELNQVSEEDYIDLRRAGFGRCLLRGLPDWLVAYSARLVRFINFERTKLPAKILEYNLEEKKKYFLEISVEMERSDAELQAEGVYSQRLQNLALTLDKVRYVLRCVFGDPKKAPPPLQKLSPEEVVSVLWNGRGSLVDELLESMASHVDNRIIHELKSEIRAHNPSSSGSIEKELRKSLLWLRDEVRNLNSSTKCRHDAAADLLHIYAYTKSFFKIKEYKSFTSPPVYISPLDLGPKCANKLSGVTEYCKTYGENYCLGQLIFWHNQTKADPDHELAKNSRGCLALPEVSSFYTKLQKPSRQQQLVYGPNSVRYMLARMEKRPQRRWPTHKIWSFKQAPKIFGSPMLDAVLNETALEREMVVWLKNRPLIFQGNWDH